MYRPVYQIGRTAYYGYALQVSPHYDGVTLVEHGGSLAGVSSTFGFVPERGVVAAALTNVQNVPAADIWLAAVNTALGLPLGLDKKRSVEPRFDAPVELIRSFVGVYRSQEGAEVRVFFDGDVLTIETQGERFPLDSASSAPSPVSK